MAGPGLRQWQGSGKNKRRIIHVFVVSRSGNHHLKREILWPAGTQMQGAAGGGRDHRRPAHRPLFAESGADQRLHLRLCRDRRCDAHVHHRPWHQPEGADQGRPHRHPDRRRGCGCAPGGRHLIIWCFLRLCSSGQPGVLQGSVHWHHYDRHQRVHHGGHPAGAGPPEELSGHHHRQCSCY